MRDRERGKERGRVVVGERVCEMGARDEGRKHRSVRAEKGQKGQRYA